MLSLDDNFNVFIKSGDCAARKHTSCFSLSVKLTYEGIFVE